MRNVVKALRPLVLVALYVSLQSPAPVFADEEWCEAGYQCVEYCEYDCASYSLGVEASYCCAGFPPAPRHCACVCEGQPPCGEACQGNPPYCWL